MTAMRAPAVSYAGLGWPIFPCEPGTKVPYKYSNGFYDATSDLDQVDDTWRRKPRANIGLRTGINYDVLDLDVKPGGVNAHVLVPRLAEGGWLDGAAGLAETRNGGLHYFYPASGLQSGRIPHLGVDFKASGGYVLLAPSQVASDFPDLPGRYRWLHFPTGGGSPLNWPALLRELDPAPVAEKPKFTGTSDPGRRLEGLCRTVESAAEGNRNHALFWAACTLRDDQQLDQVARAALVEAAGRVGLPGWEAERTIASAARRGGGR